MTRHLTSINLVLITLVGALCVYQWVQEKQYAKRISDLDHTSNVQSGKIAEQAESLKQAGEDLAGFKEQVTASKSQIDSLNEQLRKSNAQVFVLQNEKQKLTSHSSALQGALDEYKKAVAVRDDNIKTLLDQREQLISANKEIAGKANQAITSYNDLTAKYEDVVNRFNALAERYKAEHTTETGSKK